ncbi:MAG: prephenate/arogenate dehydrogenase family protein [Rhizobiaceae bacterium]|nr:prephenate/arogenate dehydrogenase family protein [Rhizobiaceae bacterium]
MAIFEKVALIGIGLIGSSIARVVREREIINNIAISTRSQETLDAARDLGLGDEYNIDASAIVHDADLVIICTPIGVVGKVLQSIAGNLKPGAIVSDVSSVKASVLEQMQPFIPDGVHLVPAHPVAGTEKSGPQHGFSTLFDNRWCILTPPSSADKAAVKLVSEFWQACGSNIEIMDADHHDRVLAITSHLPQLVAYNMVGTADDLETVTSSEVIKYSAGGFRDSTRLAASDPTMWRDVCLHNKDSILEMLTRFSEELSAMQKAVRWGDGEALFEMFTRTRNIRRDIIDAGQEVDTPNFGRDQK